MKRETAKSVTDLILRHGREQDQLLVDLQDKCDAEEFNEIRSIIGKTLGSLYSDCLQPIFEEHPDLKPDGLL